MSEHNNNEMKDDVSNVTEKSSEATSTVEKTKEVAETTKETLPTKLTENELATLDYNDFSTPARMLALGAVLAKSQLVPLKKAEDVVTALMTGKELGLPFITSVSQIYPINGRPTLGVHIQRGILIKNGVLIEKIEDAVEIYKFVKNGEDGKPIKIKKEDNTASYVVVGTGTIKEQPDNTSKKKIDNRTSYRFTRKIQMADGSYETLKVNSSFTLIEAMEAELTTKDVWKKYWRRMLDARAFTIGAREVADDLLLGLMAPNELSSNFYVNEKGEEVHKATIVE